MNKVLYITGMYLLVQLGVGVAVSLFTLAESLQDGAAIDTNRPTSPTLLLVALLIASILCFVFGILICRKGWKAPFGWNQTRPHATRIILLSLLATIPLVVFSNCVTEILGLPDIMADSFKEMSNNWWSLCVMAVVGPLAEEVCFRFGIVGSLVSQNRLKPWSAIMVSAMIFGIIHMNPAQMLGATIIGAYFGWLYVKTQSVWPSLLCHIFNNAIAVGMLHYFSSEQTISQMLPSQAYVYIVIAGSAIVLALLLIPLHKALKPFA